MSQRGVLLPARWARRALSARLSSFPADASASISRSQAFASNSRNHSRKAASSSVERARTSFSSLSTLLTRASLDNDKDYGSRNLLAITSLVPGAHLVTGATPDRRSP